MAQVALAGRRFDESELVGLLRRGDEAATELLVRQLRLELTAADGRSDALYIVSRAFRANVLGYLSRDWFPHELGSAEEVWNDTLLRVHQRIDRFDPARSKFRTWIFNQARFAALDHRRKAPHEASARDLPGAPPEEHVPLTRQEEEALQRAMKRLTELERTLLQLRVVEECSYDEIASTNFGGRLTELQARQYVFRAIKRLRGFFDDELEEEARR